MPNGSLLKQYRPNGVMNVVRSRDSSGADAGFWQGGGPI